ncbi:DUF192 domain-containing protein [Oxalobacter formigenes]|uniref:Putative ACR, COG1430 n=2 Tax=Oxalobacter TaxID=846 RepID=C3XAQ7_OXAFO|nr:hypothetical protein BRW83_0808 [Oxalobacter formigenes]ARQ77819.1 hypothetical protein BRW84_03690 [Oxalobacter formigenes OXCC13]EEO30283.1 putative ACR, COG1430 [Oxalobacter formigenes OXCC13]QDX33638.1 DUF192 domain-containing protein [Oxalobacter formigenes]
MLKLKKIILVFLCLLPFTAPAMAESTGMNFPVTTLKAGKHLIRAEVASTEAQREQGLMFRRELPKNNGMLFVFDRPARSCMWMKNTALPLSVAFIDANGTILNIEKMEPFTLDSHCSKGWIRYALEMNKNWFAKNGIKAGSKISGLP